MSKRFVAEVTPLGRTLMRGTPPKDGVAAYSLRRAHGMDVGHWSRTKHPVGAHGHAISQWLRLSAREVSQWSRHIAAPDCSQHYARARDWMTSSFGRSAWRLTESIHMQLVLGNSDVLLEHEMELVEVHTAGDPGATFLSVVSGVEAWTAAALRDVDVHAWVGFCALKREARTEAARPTLVGLTAELARSLAVA